MKIIRLGKLHIYICDRKYFLDPKIAVYYKDKEFNFFRLMPGREDFKYQSKERIYKKLNDIAQYMSEDAKKFMSKYV